MTYAELARMRAVADEARVSPFDPDALSRDERAELDVLAFGTLRQAERRRSEPATTITEPDGTRVVHVHPRKA